MNKFINIVTPIILSFVGGFFDIYCLIYRGGNFCFLQTGNLIYLARDIINSNYPSVYRCLYIFAAFSIGLIIANLLSYLLRKKNKECLIHIILLTIVFFLIIPNYFFAKTNTFDWSYIGVFALGLVGGILLESFRFSYLAYTSTMMTNNYKMFMHALLTGVIEKNKGERHKAYIYFLIILAFVLGVLIYTLFYKYDIITQYIIFLPHLLILILMGLEIYKIKKVGVIDEK